MTSSTAIVDDKANKSREGHISMKTVSTENIEDITVREKNASKDIIFLPFDPYWELFIMITVLFNFINDWMVIFFKFEMSTTKSIIYYFCEIAYFADTVALIAHRRMLRHRKKRYHQPRSIMIIVINVLTLIPFYEMHYLLYKFTWDNTAPVDYTKIKCSFRLVRLFIYSSEKRNDVGLNGLIMIVVNHAIRLLLCTSFLCVVWYLMSCWQCKHPDWTHGLDHYFFNPNESSHWLVISYHVVTSIFAHNWTGRLFGTSVDEKLFITMMALAGFMLHIMIFFGELTAGFIQYNRHQFEFTTRLKKIVYLLDDWHVDREVKRKTIEYYNVFWEKRYGMRDVPSVFRRLPVSLQKEVNVDIFWESLRHSHIFTDTDMSFKRSVSMIMKSEFLLPGDYLFRSGELKAKMVYIVYGVIQILSDEDDESSILSFSSGSILGETTCLIPAVCAANVKCATYCELHTLDLRSLFTVLVQNRMVTRTFLDMLKNRIEEAKTIAGYLARYPKSEYANDTSIKKLKRQWRNILELYHARKQADESLWNKLDKKYCSEYMDLMVLSEEVELKVQAICLKSNCPFVMDPDTSFRKFCDYIIMVNILGQSIFLPYYIFFMNMIPAWLNFLHVIWDLFYYLDIYLVLSTAIKIESKLITNSREIIMYRLKQVSFIVDVASAIPYCKMFEYFDHTNYSMLGKIPRIFKVYKIFKFIQEKERNLWINSLYMRLLKYLLLIGLSIYYLSCILYAGCCFQNVLKETGWYKYNMLPINGTFYMFQVSLFYTLSLYLDIGCSDNNAYDMLNIILTTIVILIGYFMYSFSFAELTASAVLRVKKIYAHQDEVCVMKRVMKRRLVSADLHSKLMKVLEFNWLFNEGAEVQGSNGILNDGSTKIKTDIINDRIVACLKLVPLFQHFDEDLIKSLSTHMQVLIIPARTHILNINYIPITVYIILRGYCEMHSTLPGDKERGAVLTLKRGDLLAPLEVLHRLKMFGSIETTTAVETMQLDYDKFLDIIRSHRSEYQFIRNALDDHMRCYETILMRKGCRLPPMVSVRPSFGKLKSFSYTIYNKKTTEQKTDDYMKAFNTLRQWSFVRFLLLRRTINPRSRYFIAWEVIRAITILIDLLITLHYISVLLKYSRITDYVTYVIRSITYIDLYVRLHCQYYNELGILVTHPLRTSRHYLRTSFALDLLAGLPITILQIPQLFGKNYIHQGKTVIRTIMRTLYLHRIFNGLTHIENQMHWSTGSTLMKAKYTILLAIILIIYTNALLLLTCTIKENGINCDGHNWMRNSPFRNKTKPHMLYVQTLYFIVSIYTNSLSGVFGVAKTEELTTFIVILTSLYFLRSLMLAKFTSSTIGGNINLSTYQARVKQFLKFAKEVKMDEVLVKETVQHYEYVWKETQGTSIIKIGSKFNVYLRVKFVCFLYETTLRSTTLFVNSPPSVLQRIADAVQEVHFKKDGEIIRCNDVQNMIYIVYKGSVNVSIAQVNFAWLGRGGVFGCVSRNGVVRQTITVTANVHTTLLAIESKEFFAVMSGVEGEHVEHIIKEIKSLNVEFLEPFVDIRISSDESQLSGKASHKLSNKYNKYINRLNEMIDQEGFWFWLLEYLLNVHVATISSITCMASVFIDVVSKHSPVENDIYYLVDALFVIKIFFGFTLQYVDSNTGIKETQPKKVAKKYFKSAFWFDLFVVFPFELFTALFTDTYNKVASLNRALRYVYLVKYYNECNYKLTISKHLRWTYLIYRTLFHIQFMANIWLVTACFQKRCVIVTNRYGRPTETKEADSPLTSVIAGYTYVINVFTSTGMRDVSPNNTSQLVASIIISFAAQFLIATLASGFASLIIIENNTMSNYKHNIEKLKIYLKGRHLSPPIFQSAWEYLLQLWKIQRGEWTPLLMHRAPSYLQQDIMKFLYIHHLENHFLFSRTHKDFLRQLVVHLERCVYFPGNHIVEQGDIDNTMYFIHKGEVGAFDKSGANEFQCFMLSTGMSFGEAQGLHQIAYQLTYKALTTVDILALSKRKWEYLLKWFPASEEELIDKSKEYGLLMRKSYASDEY